jgi:hypothetical protein
MEPYVFFMNIDLLTGVIAVSLAVVIVALLCYSPPPADIHDIGPGATPRKISSATGLGTGAGDLESLNTTRSTTQHWRSRRNSMRCPVVQRAEIMTGKPVASFIPPYASRISVRGE